MTGDDLDPCGPSHPMAPPIARLLPSAVFSSFLLLVQVPLTTPAPHPVIQQLLPPACLSALRRCL